MRRGMTWVPVALLATVTAEILLFVVVAQLIGAGWAVLVAAGVSLVGLLLLRREGVRAWRRFRAAAQADEPPGRQVSDGLVGLLGALLLAVPGYATGVLGLLLLTPPLRGVARAGVQRAAERRVSSALAGDLFGPRRVRVRRGAAGDAAPRPDAAGGPPPPAAVPITGEVVEGEIVDVRPPGGH